jgi:hypothetical protein
MANSYLNRTQSSATSDKIGTFSAWIKLSSFSDAVFSGHTDSSNRIALYFSDTLRIYGAIGGSQSVYLITNQVFRDPSAYYHVVIAWDTTQGTDSNRFKIYVNGSQITNLATASYPTQNADVYWNKGTTSIVGARYVSSITNYFDGYMSHVAFVDGQQLAPTVFGETDSTSGIWKFKQPSGVTWGNNGFWLKFENSGALGTDSSGNSNTFTVNGNGRQALDTPTNVYATYNSLTRLGDYNILSNGNTTQKETSGVGQRQAICNIGGFTGKWYTEFKMINLGPQDGSSPYCGVLSMDNYVYNTYLGNNGIAMHPNGNVYKGASVIDSQTSITYTTNSIVSVALDITNNKCHFRVNGGTWLASGNPVNNTGGYDISSLNTGDALTFASSVYNNNCQWDANFGNGYFGTTAITSAGSNGNGSLFEYDVPSGYYALNTKNINTYG